MKKSTLITTIAMIVVVVVALSTATYAWFSTTTATYANLTIGTTADTNLTVTVNTVGLRTTTDEAVFNGSDFLSNTQFTEAEGPVYTLDKLGVRGGLWIPNTTAALTIKPASDNEAAVVTNENSPAFLTGTIDKADSALKEINQGVTSPDMIRVVNNMPNAQTVTLTIYIGCADNNQSKYAASGVSVYLADTTGCIANTDYYTMKTTAWTTGDIENAATASTWTKVSKSGFTDSSAKNHVDSISSFVGTAKAAETAGATDAELKAAEAGITVGHLFYTLTIELGDLNQTEGKNYLVYNWLDGAYLTDSAKSANLSIGYAFTSVNKV